VVADEEPAERIAPLRCGAPRGLRPAPAAEQSIPVTSMHVYVRTEWPGPDMIDDGQPVFSLIERQHGASRKFASRSSP
jgi:hypothetical protein